MSALLLQWVDCHRGTLESHGLEILVWQRHEGGSASVNLDSGRLTGTVTHWPPDRFEFQFNDNRTGEVIFIEEVILKNVESVCHYFDRIYAEIAQRTRDA